MKNKGAQIFHLALAVWLLLNTGTAMKYCKTKEDCLSLGDLECVKTTCEWGLCSCPRGKASRYLGSEKLFKCVRQNKVGESCSEDGDDGVCGADNSFCINGTCECEPGYISRFGGEICMRVRDIYPSETLSGSSSSCQNSGRGRPPSFVNGGPAVCTCPQGSQTQLPNTFGNTFQGKKIPTCIGSGVGDFCVVDEDCQFIQSNAICKDNKCACENKDHVADISRLRCGPPLTFGQACIPGSSIGVCTGSKGLSCGPNVCDVKASSTTNITCGCHYTYIQSGTTCQSRKIGDECYGDENCKGINMNAICVDGYCQNAATTKHLCFTLLLFCVIFRLL